MSRTKSMFVTTLALVIIAGLLSACAGAPATPTPAPKPPAAAKPAEKAAPPAKAQAPEKPNLAVSILPISECLPVFVASKLGYFKDEGLNVETKIVGGGAEAIPILQAGKLDIAFSNTVSTVLGKSQGIDLTILASGAKARSAPPDVTSALMVSATGPIKTLKDIEGKRIAVNNVSSINWVHTKNALEASGVDTSKIQWSELGFPQMNDPLINGQVDAITQVEPFRTILESAGKAKTLQFSFVASQPSMDISQYIAIRKFVQENPITVGKFKAALAKAVNLLNSNEAQARELNAEFTKLDPALKDKVMLPLFRTEADPKAVQDTADIMLKHKMLSQKYDTSSLFQK
ncbi:MAG: ABC transporter substrate-binding protein [Chloroflexi bacterium]|nr:ABC transporter substrate-binding protein [Chloroflexota bacterium]